MIRTRPTSLILTAAPAALVALLILSADCGQVRAASTADGPGHSTAVASDPGALVFAQTSSKFSLRRLFSGLNTRTRIVQFCMVVMVVALLILCKKLDGAEPSYRQTLRGEEHLSPRSGPVSERHSPAP